MLLVENKKGRANALNNVHNGIALINCHKERGIVMRVISQVVIVGWFIMLLQRDFISVIIGIQMAFLPTPEKTYR